jgi:nucleotide-binding universal stress UspA family protein
MPASSPTPFSKILVCTDGSSASEGAINAALQLAQTSGGKIFLLEVIFYPAGYELQSPDTFNPPVINQEMMEAQETAVKERMEKQKSEAAKLGVTLETRIRTSPSPHEGIMEEAQELKPDLIIMGRRGYTGLTRLLMGSVTAQVIGHSPSHVLVVPREAVLDFNRILIASDGSSFSEAAWEAALSLAQVMGSAVTAVSVAADDRDVAGATKTVKTMESAAQAQGIVLDTMIPTGRADEAIVNAAIFKNASLIVVGSHGRTGLKRLLMGSVAEGVVSHARCPVLVVKKK